MKYVCRGFFGREDGGFWKEREGCHVMPPLMRHCRGCQGSRGAKEECHRSAYETLHKFDSVVNCRPSPVHPE